MAIDTQQKRLSVMGMGMPWRWPHVPDGSVGQGERQAGTYYYSGILWGEVLTVDVAPGPTDVLRFRSHDGDILRFRSQPEDTAIVLGGS